MRIAKEASFILLVSLGAAVSVNHYRSDALPLVPASQPDAPSKQVLRQVSPTQAENILRDGVVSVIDLRPRDLYEKNHRPGAVNMPLETIYSMMGVIQEEMPRNQGMVLFGKGSDPSRVSEVAGVLQMMGYETVYLLMEEWESGHDD